MSDEEKVVHFAFGGCAYAPCGARVSVTMASYEFTKVGLKRTKEHAGEMPVLMSSASTLDRVTCSECQYHVTLVAKEFNRARRLKLISWGGRMRKIVNKREGRCAETSCDRRVLPKDGVAVLLEEGGSWKVFCKEHEPREKPCAMCGAVPAELGRHHNTNCGFWSGRR